MITYKGNLVDRWSKSYVKTDGNKGINAFIVIQTGMYEGKASYMSFETSKPEIINKIKSLKNNDLIEVSGYLNCAYGTSKKTGNKYAILKINIASIELTEKEQQSEQKENIGSTEDDLPF